MQIKPSVAVCIPTYNRGHILEQAIDSVLSQTYTSFELIISDDAGATDIRQQLKKYNDSRLRIIVQKHNLGIVKNFNACINACTASIIKPLCDDDCLHPRCLELIVGKMGNYQIGVIGSSNLSDESYPVWNENLDVTIHPTERGLTKEALAGARITPTNVFFTRSLWRKIGPYCENAAWAFDWDFYVRSRCIYDIANFEAALCIRREWPESATVKSTDPFRNYYDLFLTLDYLWDAYPSKRNVIRNKAIADSCKYLSPFIKCLLSGKRENSIGFLRAARKIFRYAW